MIASWPTGLPLLNAADFKLAPVDVLARTEVEDGPALSRPMALHGPHKATGSVTLTGAQLDELDSFHHYTLRDGADGFEVNMLTGAKVRPQLAKFSAPYEANQVGADTFTVPLQLVLVSDPRRTTLGAQIPGSIAAPALLGEAPNPHTPVKLVVTVRAAFLAGATLDVGEVDGDADSLAAAVPLDAEATITIDATSLYAGANLGVEQAAVLEYIATVTGADGTGDAVAVLRWE